MLVLRYLFIFFRYFATKESALVSERCLTLNPALQDTNLLFYAISLLIDNNTIDEQKHKYDMKIDEQKNQDNKLSLTRGSA